MLVPKLRFKEFNDEWHKINLNNIFKFYGTNSLSRENLSNSGTIQNIHYGDIHQKFNNILNINKTELPYIKPNIHLRNISEDNYCRNGDLIFADASEDYEGIGKAIEIINIENNKILSGLHTILARDIENIMYTGFKGYLFNTPIVHNQIRVLANGFKVYGISKDVIVKLNVNIPSKQEQEKIANFLSLLDKKIELQQRKIEALKIYKRGLIQRIYATDNNFNKIKLSDILEEVSKKTIVNNQYDVISSTKDYLILQKEYFNRNIASENNVGYKILKKDQVVLSPQNLWMGNINFNDKYEIGIVSPSYKIFNINPKYDKNYIAYLLRTDRAFYFYTISSEQGASIVRRNLNMEAFNEISFNIPDIKTQRKYGYILKIFSAKLQIENNRLHTLYSIKQSLLQQMFI